MSVVFLENLIDTLSSLLGRMNPCQAGETTLWMSQSKYIDGIHSFKSDFGYFRILGYTEGHYTCIKHR